MPSPLKIVELCQKPIFASYFDHFVSKSEVNGRWETAFLLAFSPHKSALRPTTWPVGIGGGGRCPPLTLFEHEPCSTYQYITRSYYQRTFTVNFFRPFFRRVHNLPKDAQFSPFRYDKKIIRQKSEKSYEIAIFITTQVVYTFEAIEACY